MEDNDTDKQRQERQHEGQQQIYGKEKNFTGGGCFIIPCQEASSHLLTNDIRNEISITVLPSSSSSSSFSSSSSSSSLSPSPSLSSSSSSSSLLSVNINQEYIKLLSSPVNYLSKISTCQQFRQHNPLNVKKISNTNEADHLPYHAASSHATLTDKDSRNLLKSSSSSSVIPSALTNQVSLLSTRSDKSEMNEIICCISREVHPTESVVVIDRDYDEEDQDEEQLLLPSPAMLNDMMSKIQSRFF